MKQVIRRGFKEIIVDEVPEPVLAPHHLLVRSLFSVISSGTEAASLHQEGVLQAVADNPSHLRTVWESIKSNGPYRTLTEVRAKFREYAVLGYSGAGIVVDKHPTITDLEVGDRVAYGGEGTGHGETILAGRKLTVKVPADVPLEHAGFATLGSIALNAVRLANLSLGERVVVLGLGLVGQLVAQLARLQGASVMATDLKPDRVELAARLGADDVLPSGPGLAEAVAALTRGRGADCVIVAAASKSSLPCEQALRICRDRGRLVVVGAVQLNFPWQEMYLKEIQLFMSRAYGPGSLDPEYEQQGRDYPFAYVRWTENRNMEEFLRLLATQRVDVGPLITHQFPLEQAAQAYQTILDPHSNSLAVLLRFPAADFPKPAGPQRRRVEIQTRDAAFSELQVALVGAGNLARWAHLPNLRKIPHVRLKAVCSGSGARGKSFALRFGAAYCTSNYEEILQDPQVNVVLITSRNQHHAAQSLAALRAGKHVFVEKPMALTEEECRLLVAAAEQTGKNLTVGFNRRFAPFYVEFKRHLQRRAGPAVVNCRINSPGISGSYWMADPAIGGAIVGEACHFVDLTCWLLDSEPLSVFAYSLPRGSGEPIGENNLVASLRFQDGSIANLTYCTVGSRTSGGERVEAFAPGLGLAIQDFKRLSIQTTLRRNHSQWWAEKGYAAQLETFLSGIRASRPPEVTARDGARATLACLRMLESARSGRPCALELDRVLTGP